MSEETTLDINGDAFSQHSFASEIVMHIIYSFLSVHNTLRFIQFPLLLLPLWPLLNALTEKVGGIFIPIWIFGVAAPPFSFSFPKILNYAQRADHLFAFSRLRISKPKCGFPFKWWKINFDDDFSCGENNVLHKSISGPNEMKERKLVPAVRTHMNSASIWRRSLCCQRKRMTNSVHPLLLKKEKKSRRIPRWLIISCANSRDEKVRSKHGGKLIFNRHL